ncbi:MAG: MBOAT family protein [Lachnospiraceae bacterium]|nr:MBOAT family protein [Lachnospiraceae bacterium]
MVFSSIVFLSIFLPITVLLYYLIRPLAARNILLLAVSLIFYAYGEPVFIFLMMASMLVNYFLGLALGQGKGKKAVLVTAILLNLGMLALFKYSSWVIMGINGMFRLSIPTVTNHLPIGISFYTFQALSYLIDVYRGQVKQQKNVLYFFLYISFFPQLIAGPIIKYHDIELQITDRHVDADQVAAGFRRFIIGLGKKVLISNIVAAAADYVFALSGSEMCALSAWIGAISYMLQIYFDFSGYSDMAIGLGKIFGFTFQENFRYPYASDTMKEFWRRWHISLSTWFKEYLYIPLGGNRKGKIRTSLNKLFVFFCTGLWHGANLTFVVWGLFHGAFLFLEEYVPIRKLPKVIRHIYSLLVICVGFVIFRADNMAQAGLVLKNMFTGFSMTHAQYVTAMKPVTALYLVVLVLAVVAAFELIRKAAMVIMPKNEGTAVLLANIWSILVLILCFLYLSGGSYNPFIYFRF